MSWRNRDRKLGSAGRQMERARHFTRKSANIDQFTPPPAPPLGRLVEDGRPEALTRGFEHVRSPVTITGCELLASFNWLDQLRPGMKYPAWKPLLKATKLQEDSGEFFRDQNSTRYPKHPIEPAARAVLAGHPDFDTQSVDIFVCGSMIGNLLRCVRGEYKPFRFLVNAIGRTVFFVRRENAPDQKIPDVRGYGHTFPARCTEWASGVENSASHQRLLSYDFAGLKCIVRLEGDGYLVDEVGEELEEGLGPSGPLPEISGVDIFRGGKLITQRALFDLKTRTLRKKSEDVMAAEMGRLWITQIPFFVLAFHEHGRFSPGDITVKKTNTATWE